MLNIQQDWQPLLVSILLFKMYGMRSDLLDCFMASVVFFGYRLGYMGYCGNLSCVGTTDFLRIVQ